MFLEVLSFLQSEFKSWHEKLSRLNNKSMFILTKLGVLLKRFIYLKDDVPIYALLMSVTLRIKKMDNKR